MLRACIGTAVLLAALVAPRARAQNQLTNPGFEAGTLNGWVVGGPRAGTVGVGPAGTLVSSDFGIAPSLVHAGLYSASGSVRGACCTSPEGFRLAQTVALVPGATYSVGFWMVNPGVIIDYGVDTGDAFTQIFVDGTGLLGAGYFTAVMGSWQQVSASFIAPERATTVTFQVVGSGQGFAPLSVDDFYVVGPTASLVPEPAPLAPTAAGLLAVGVAAARRRQRRA